MLQIINQICMVSDRNVAEVLGATIIKGETTVLHAITTPQMDKMALNLEKTCAALDIKCQLHRLPRHNEPDTLLNLLNAIHAEKPDESWLVNLTGGTKLMAITVFAWAEEHGIPAIYIDTGKKTIHIYQNGTWSSDLLPETLDYEALLTLYGFQIKNKKEKRLQDHWTPLLYKMAALASSLQGRQAIHTLNSRAWEATNTHSLYAPAHIGTPSFQQILNLGKSMGKLDFSSLRVTFKDIESREWCKGLWLEDYAQSILEQLQKEGKINSWASSVIVESEGVTNELDAVFTTNNRLFVLECKTAKIDKQKSILYKADSIRGMLGKIYTQFMICSADYLKEEEKKRASNMGLQTVQGEDLKYLRNRILAWIEN